MTRRRASPRRWPSTAWRRGGRGVGERGEAGEDGRGARGHDDRGRERRGVGGHGERRGGPGSHGAHGGREAREVPSGAPLRARRGLEPGGVAASPHGARLGLERCERDQRLAEAAVRVREAEEVVKQPVRERRPHDGTRRRSGSCGWCRSSESETTEERAECLRVHAGNMYLLQSPPNTSEPDNKISGQPLTRVIRLRPPLRSCGPSTTRPTCKLNPHVTISILPVKTSAPSASRRVAISIFPGLPAAKSPRPLVSHVVMLRLITIHARRQRASAAGPRT